MRRRPFAGRRVVCLLSLTAALVVLVLTLGVGSATAATSVGCGKANRSIDGTSVAASWCWDKALNLTIIDFDKSQSFSWAGCFSTGITVNTHTGGVGDHTFSETWTSSWACPLAGDTLDSTFWIHVVGGSTTLDFVNTG